MGRSELMQRSLPETDQFKRDSNASDDADFKKDAFEE
jgi:hypothetical protein